jgi:hypothetical protein
MARGKLEPGMKERQFKKGQSGNPRGGQLHNPATKALAKMTVPKYREVIELVMSGKVKDLQAMIQNPNTDAIQVGIATSFLKAIKNGDYLVIERIAERIIGKIPEQLNVNSTANNFNANVNVALDQEILKKAMKELEEDV